jgi:predicted hydrocarbon binding protein
VGLRQRGRYWGDDEYSRRYHQDGDKGKHKNRNSGEASECDAFQDRDADVGARLGFHGIGAIEQRKFLVTSLPGLLSERYRMALRMGGAKTGKDIGKHLIKSGMSRDEAIRRLADFMEYCRVGIVTIGETIRIRDNCESYGLETGEPSCFFTTGFLNGAFSTLKGQHLRELKCLAAGDPYCEWQIT